jgi:hypothetical protein
VCALIWFDRACEGGNTEGFLCHYENAHVLSDALSRDVRWFSISLERCSVDPDICVLTQNIAQHHRDIACSQHMLKTS